MKADSLKNNIPLAISLGMTTPAHADPHCCQGHDPTVTRGRSFGFQNNKNWQKQQYQRNRWNRGGHPPIKNRDASVTVRPEWKVIEEMDFPRLSKLSLPNIEDPKDL